MECAPNGDLAGHLERSRRFGEAEAAKYMVQTSSAILFCHSRGVIHRDIKPENLLLDTNYDIKARDAPCRALWASPSPAAPPRQARSHGRAVRARQVTDFGLSAIIKPGQLLKVACGTPSYSAPEVIARKEYDGALTDVWSLGVLLYHMTHGSLPFSNTNQIRAGEYAVAQEAMAPGAHDLLRRMLVVRPDKRLLLPQARSCSRTRSGAGKHTRRTRRSLQLTLGTQHRSLKPQLSCAARSAGARASMDDILDPACVRRAEAAVRRQPRASR
eukprot:6084879-Prymnesium_polylepis.1